MQFIKFLVFIFFDVICVIIELILTKVSLRKLLGGILIYGQINQYCNAL